MVSKKIILLTEYMAFYIVQAYYYNSNYCHVNNSFQTASSL